MHQQLVEKPEATPVPAREPGRDSMLLIDQYLPGYDFAVVHARVLPARPEACYRVARGVDLLRDPVIRTLLHLRSLPQRLANRLAGHRDAATGTRTGDYPGVPLHRRAESDGPIP